MKLSLCSHEHSKQCHSNIGTIHLSQTNEFLHRWLHQSLLIQELHIPVVWLQSHTQAAALQAVWHSKDFHAYRWDCLFERELNSHSQWDPIVFQFAR